MPCFRSESYGQLRKALHGRAEPQFFGEWVWTLEKLIEIAQRRDTCSWEAPLIPGDHNYWKTWSEISTGMLERLERNVAQSAGEKRQFWQRVRDIVRQAMNR